MSPKMDMTNAGIRYKGSWEDICHFARNLENIIKKCVSNGDSVERYYDWRPREDEVDEDITEKTAEEATIKTQNIEKNFNGTKQELEEAGEKLKESVEHVKKGQNPGKNIKDATRHVGRLVGTKSIQGLRKMEKTIYERLMLKFNPHYFDTEDFSVNLEKNGKGYILTINIPDDKIRNNIKSLVKRQGC